MIRIELKLLIYHTLGSYSSKSWALYGSEISKLQAFLTSAHNTALILWLYCNKYSTVAKFSFLGVLVRERETSSRVRGIPL